VNEEWWESASFHLSYTAHGGSGLGRTYTELLDMNADHIMRDLERLEEQREREAAAIRGAGRR
jgi:hypothetical protein